MVNYCLKRLISMSINSQPRDKSDDVVITVFVECES